MTKKIKTVSQKEYMHYINDIRKSENIIKNFKESLPYSNMFKFKKDRDLLQKLKNNALKIGRKVKKLRLEMEKDFNKSFIKIF